jgi:hypothetical protein
MQLLVEIPKPPSTLNKVGKQRWNQICKAMLDGLVLTAGSLHCIEAAAYNYARWMEFEQQAGDDPESFSRVHAQRHCRLYLSCLKDLGLSKPEKKKALDKPKPIDAAPPPPPKTKTALRILPIDQGKKGKTG